jgi:predicted MPP superfamily phosphohydrolase
VAHGLRRQSNARLLVNESTIVERDGERLAIVGIGDPAGKRSASPDSPAPDIPRALSRVPTDVPVVAFAHNPALWPALADHGVALTLSGHTHWGQLAFPRRGWSLASPFLEHAMGAFQRGDSLLYVHPGTGFWGIPFRLGAFPEIALVTLRRSVATGIEMGKARKARVA